MYTLMRVAGRDVALDFARYENGIQVYYSCWREHPLQHKKGLL